MQNLNAVICCAETRELRVLLRLDYDFCVQLSTDSLKIECLIQRVEMVERGEAKEEDDEGSDDEDLAEADEEESDLDLA